jgi:hypothetical protein
LSTFIVAAEVVVVVVRISVVLHGLTGRAIAQFLGRTVTSIIAAQLTGCATLHQRIVLPILKTMASPLWAGLLIDVDVRDVLYVPENDGFQDLICGFFDFEVSSMA